MIQNSLERLLAGISESLRDVVLPATDDAYARAQARACIELIGNLATRVEWRHGYLDEISQAAERALAAASDYCPELSSIGDDGIERASLSPLLRRDRALRHIALAVRWCEEHDADSHASRVLDDFARWHTDFERELLRTGMYSS